MSYHQDLSWNDIFLNPLSTTPGNQVKMHESSSNPVMNNNGLLRIPLSEWNYPVSSLENASQRREEKAAFRSNGKDCFLQGTHNATYVNYPDQALQDTSSPFDPYAIFSHYEHVTFVEPQVSIEVRYNFNRNERPVFIAPIPSYARAPQYSPSSSSKPSTQESTSDIQSLISTKDVPVEISYHQHCFETAKKENTEGNVCSHCKTDSTSLWRRLEGMLMCNACALYFKLHGVNRPLYLNTGVVKRRNRLGSSTNKRQRRYRC